MKKFYVLPTLLCCLFLQISFAQVRYVDEVFTDDQITVVKDVQYSVAMDIFAEVFDPAVDVPVPIPLGMDVYMPNMDIDDVAERPVVFVPSEGNVPRYVAACYGAKDDMMVVDRCTRLAKMGYVCMGMDSRKGYNFFASTPNGFLRGASRATLRGTADLKSAARFVRKNHAESGNTYGIDPNKFVAWGTNTAGFTQALHLDRVEDFQGTAYFVANPETGEVENVFDVGYFGDIDGLEPGFDPADGALSNLPSNTGCYSSEFQLLVANGYVTLDTTFIQGTEPPIITFFGNQFATASLEFGPLTLPATQEYCCDVFFSNQIARHIDRQTTINDAWKGVSFSNPIANRRDNFQPDPSQGPIEGYFGLGGNPENQRPWVYWDKATCDAVNPALEEGDMLVSGWSVERGRAQLDTMIQYIAPRACITLGLDCAEITTGLREENVETARITVSPNPSNSVFTFETPAEHQMEAIHIYNMTGSLVYKAEVFHNQFTAANLSLSSGTYLAKVRFEDGVASKKIVVTD